jgi:hypothetical protein
MIKIHQIHQESIHGDFFNLTTGLAGEILQKFSNYRMRLAVLGDFSDIESKSLRDFIRESNSRGVINFGGTLEEAYNGKCMTIAWLMRIFSLTSSAIYMVLKFGINNLEFNER